LSTGQSHRKKGKGAYGAELFLSGGTTRGERDCVEDNLQRLGLEVATSPAEIGKKIDVPKGSQLGRALKATYKEEGGGDCPYRKKRESVGSRVRKVKDDCDRADRGKIQSSQDHLSAGRKE